MFTRACRIIVFLLLLSVSAHATNYYFSATGSGTACTLLAPGPLSQVTSHGAAGDSLLFHKGDTFTGTINYTRSGSSGSRIVFDLYGTAVNNAIIDAGASTTASVIQISGSFITVNNLQLTNSKYGNGIVYIVTSTATNVIINNCHVYNGILGIYAHLGTAANNIKILHNWVEQISDITHARGSPIQLDNVSGSGIEIAYNSIYYPVTLGDSNLVNRGVGDLISLFKSNGTSSSQILVHHNRLRGGGSKEFGFSGINPGDVGGSWEHLYNNRLANTGVAGIQIPGGKNITVENDSIYSDNFPYSVIGLHYYNASADSTYNITAQTNAINWNGANYGTTFSNLKIDVGGANTVSGISGGAPLPNPTGWSTNTQNGVNDPTVNNSILPDPLWTGSPWNTITIPVITYTSPNNFSTGQSVTLTPTNTGGVATSWTCSPTLPVSLSINSGTGIITGTLTSVAAMATYTVTATNTAGHGTFPLVISVTSTGVGHLFFTRTGELVIKWH